MFIAAGPAACHCFVGDSAGNLWSWGRNEARRGSSYRGDGDVSVSCGVLLRVLGSVARTHHIIAFIRHLRGSGCMRSEIGTFPVRLQKGQLGHGDFAQRNVPAKLPALEGKFVIGGEYCTRMRSSHGP
jgi:hypothetical protein